MKWPGMSEEKAPANNSGTTQKRTMDGMEVSSSTSIANGKQFIHCSAYGVHFAGFWLSRKLFLFFKGILIRRTSRPIT